VLVGLAIGHGVWKSTNAPVSNAGSFGTNPFGSGGSGNGSGGSGSGSSGSSGSGSSGTNGSGSGSTGGSSGGTQSLNVAGVVAAVSPALVDINTTLDYGSSQAAGTGIVLTSDGYILTNNHVISGSTTISVTDIGSQHTYSASVIGYDRAEDIALIKLQGASGLTVAKIGDSSKVNVGDPVVGIGNAGGTGGQPSSAAGSVTALSQSITAQDTGNGTSEQLTGLIQTNADIQPGDSGGALANSSGEVVGVDTAASTGFSFQSQGNQGFAIPIDTALGITAQIRSGNASDKVHLGSTAFLGVEVNTGQSGVSGASITGVLPNGPAAQAGIGSGDVITALGGATVSSSSTLTAVISRYHPGDKVAVTWTDSSGQTHHATIELANGPAA
jgi:S1-C subfamily serine protease